MYCKRPTFFCLSTFSAPSPPPSRQLVKATSNTENRKTLHFSDDPLVSVNYCDILTPHHSVTNNPKIFYTQRNFSLLTQPVRMASKYTKDA